MSESRLKIFYGILLIIGLLGFILHIFVFESPDGNLGLTLCLIEVTFIISSTIRLCQLSKDFKKSFLDFLKIIFRF